MHQRGFARDAAKEGFVLEGNAGSTRVREVVTSVFEIRYTGTGHAEFVPRVLEAIDRRLEEGYTVTICSDIAAVTEYDATFWRSWTEWFRANTGCYYRLPILFRSSLIRMGIQLINPLIGNMLLPLTDSAEYKWQLNAAAVRARTARPRSA